MHDINFIREHPNLFDKMIAKRGIIAVSEKILELDKVKRDTTTTIQRLQEERNNLSKTIGENKRNKNDTGTLEKLVNKLKKDISLEENNLKNISLKLGSILLQIPNLPANDIPIGKDDSFNKEVYKSPFNESNDSYIPHEEFGKTLKMMDFETAAKISGSRFVILNKSLAKLERALCNFMIDLHVEQHGYTEVSTPHLVKDEALVGTGQLPKFANDLFKINNQRWLIPTAEVTLTNIHSNSIIAINHLPKRYVALTNCFRAEAGAAGQDTKGMIRLHEFKKVELVSLVSENDSNKELERLTECASKVIEYLEIPYRKIVLSSGDMGFAASKTYDLEVWIPSQKKYREISSCSNCRDFQSRRMRSRYKDKEGNKRFVHTLNGSGVAVGRALVAIIENYQYGRNKIKVPEVLVEYMRGQKEISL